MDTTFQDLYTYVYSIMEYDTDNSGLFRVKRVLGI